MTRYASLGGPDPVDAHVGAKLRGFRKTKRVSQTALAGAVGVSFQQIQKYESGTNRISASMLYGIARRLAVPIAGFFDGLPDPELGDPSCQDDDEASRTDSRDSL